jgi:nitrite reductase (NO-forming)
MVPFHVVSGMSGAIMVLVRDGLHDAEGKSIKYDRAYYIGVHDFFNWWRNTLAGFGR